MRIYRIIELAKSSVFRIMKTVILKIAEKYEIKPDGISFITYSQDGEDLILDKIFAAKQNGFFIDIGAYHPKKYSNTYHFYKKGWRGINIDPRPGVMSEFNRVRPEDINLEIGISDREGYVQFYIFDQPGVCTFDKDTALNRNRILGYTLLEIKNIKVDTILNVFEKYAKSTDVDFMSIDVEGYELAVLEQNDWKRFRPKVILVEIMQPQKTDYESSIFKKGDKVYWVSTDELSQFKVHSLLSKNGYRVLAKTIATVFYIDSGIDI